MTSLDNRMAETCPLPGESSLPGMVNGGGKTFLGARIGMLALRYRLTDTVFMACFKATAWPRRLTFGRNPRTQKPA